MGKILSVLYGLVAYVVFLAVFLDAIAFVAGVPAPKSIDSGSAGPWERALLVNCVLLGLFAVSHSVMARPAFKRWWTQFVPSHVERSTYVLVASLLLALLFWGWQPMPAPVWRVESPLGRASLWALCALGWLVVLSSTFLINHFELFGLRQVWLHARDESHSHLPFTKVLLYRFVRHPIMLGFLVAFWATPDMTVGHLLFAVATTGYILVGVWLEERDLVTFHGDEYRRYQQEVGMLLPRKAR